MKDIIKYLDNKIKYTAKKLKIDEFFELKNLENFLCLIMDIQGNLEPEEALELYKNKNLIKKINSRYEFIKPEILDVFISQIGELSNRSPSFTSNNYTFVLGCLKKILENEDLLYMKYEELSRKIEHIEHENENLVLKKMWFEEVKNKIENEIILTDTKFIDYIFYDKLIDINYKKKLIKLIEEYNKKALKNYVPASLEDVSNLIKQYGYKITDEDYLAKISTNYKLSILKNILDTIKEKKLKFDDEILKKILSYGTSVSTINEAYNKVLNSSSYQLNAVCKIHNFWIDRTYEKSSLNKGKSSILVNRTNNVVKGNPDDLDTEDYELNSSEIFETAEYLKKFPFYNSNFVGMKSILKLSVEKLMKRENLLSLYGIDVSNIDGSMTLFAPYNITLLDQFLELDLKDYILNHLSTLSKSKSLPIVIYNEKIKGKDVTSIRNGNEYLLAKLVESAGKYNDVVENSNLIDSNVENRDLYDEILNLDSPNKIIPNVYNNLVIKYLEEKYKINELQYQIDNYFFSRKKVLRVASSLIPKQKIDFDSFLYIMTYKRIINENELINLEEKLKETYDLSKNYSI